MDKKREIWLDVLRAFACICVVMVHSPAEYDGNVPGQFVLAPANYLLMAWGVGLFFAISGALLLSKPVSLTEFYKKRFGRLILPVVLWSLIYIVYEGWFNDCLSWHYILDKVSMIPFESQAPLLWFMYTLFGIYLVVPIFANFLQNATKRECEILLLVWGITLFMPFLKLWNPQVLNSLSANGVFHNFTGFLWYAFFGYYLRKYIDWKITDFKFILLVIVSFGFPLCVSFFGILPIEVLNTLMSVFSVALTAIPFIICKNFTFSSLKPNNLVITFAKYSFGIYLFHYVLLIPLRPFLTQFHIHYALQIPVTAVVVGIVSLCIVVLLSKVPFSKYLLG